MRKIALTLKDVARTRRLRRDARLTHRSIQRRHAHVRDREAAEQHLPVHELERRQRLQRRAGAGGGFLRARGAATEAEQTADQLADQRSLLRAETLPTTLPISASTPAARRSICPVGRWASSRRPDHGPGCADHPWRGTGADLQHPAGLPPLLQFARHRPVPITVAWVIVVSREASTGAALPSRRRGSESRPERVAGSPRRRRPFRSGRARVGRAVRGACPAW